MAGASRQHNRIVTNVVVSLANQLRQRPCNVYSSDMRVKVEKCGLYTYPDILVTCGEERFADEKAYNLLNPQIIIEVLSDSTEAYDRGKKFACYQQLASLQEYLLIAQNACRVEQYVRQESQTWLYAELHESEAELALPSLNCRLSLKEIYANVDLPEKPVLRLVVQETDTE